MALICPNGHRNDDANRFCDQCGAPLSAAPESPSVAATPTTTSGSSGTSCPVCGQENVPGTAFCDNCGAALPPPLPASASETAVADLSVAGGGAETTTSTAAGSITCSQCGTANDAANRFCDNCGASIQDAAQVATTADVASPGLGVAPTATVPDDAANVPVVDMIGSTALPTEGTTVPVTPDINADVAQAMPTAASVDAAPSVPAATPSIDVDAERQRLEETITTQRQMVEQLEQMQQQFGAATPPSIRQGLDEARASLARAEADLQALPTAPPPPDPAEVARLEETITTQRRMVEQLEQMQQQFGAATPPSIRQGLDEARASLARAEADLQALTGQSSQGGSGILGKVAAAAAAATVAAAAAAAIGAARSTTPSSETEAVPAVDTTTPSTTVQTYEAPVPAVAPVDVAPVTLPEPLPPTPAVPAQPLQAAPATVVDPITPPPSMPVAPAQPRGTDQLPPAASQTQASGPRLVTRDGKQISLPRGGNEVVVGREDPISGIHPEVDLTPHGGEAGGVSRRHAVLREQNGQWSVTDLDSTNYTRVDGTRIVPNTPTPLHEGARVQFGRVELEFFTA